MQKQNAGLNWVFAILLFLSASPAWAQNKQVEEELPEPEAVAIETKDGVLLKCMWYPGTEQKQTIPVILVHDWGRTRSDMLPLAEALQKAGHAVIVPDLRGHGQSTTVNGLDEPIDFEDFKKKEMAAIFLDIDTCKRFLMRKNNAGELNIEMLTVVATHRTAIQAANWSVSDWSWPTLSDGTKQGQDVKSLILISPVKRFKSLALNSALKAPCFSGKGGFRPITVTMIWGLDDEAVNRDVESIFRMIVKGREDPADIPDEEKWDRQTIFRLPLQTGDTGSDLLFGNSAEKLETNIIGILRKTMAEKSEDFQWQDRSSRD